MASIILDNVSLEFPVLNRSSTSIRHKLVNIGTGGLVKNRRNGYKTISALRGINLRLKKNSKVGLIGHNGSGKRTLMRCISGIYSPTSGYLNVKGNLSTIFELGVGADQDLSGIENIIRIGVMMGMSYKNVKNLIPKIIDFTELGEFIHLPVRTYSAGMEMRLYFAMALFSNPDILLIDEVFGAGDAAFQSKALAKLENQIFNSKILIFASHSIEILRKFCDSCIVMSHGKIICHEQFEKAIEEYKKVTLK